MKKAGGKPKTVDAYVAALPKEVRGLVRELRATIRQSAPKAEEVISYNMPAFKQGRILVWYAAFKHHIGFFPKAAAIAAFKDDLAGYNTSKGTIQLPLDRPIPKALVKKIVKVRIEEERARAKARA